MTVAEPTGLQRTTTAEEPADLESTPGETFGASAAIALGLAVVGFVVIRLPDITVGLHSDELLSAWVTADGLADSVHRAQRFQGNSAVYFVGLWFWRQIVGSNEILLRLPSLIAFAGALWQMVRFGKDLGSRTMGAVAAAVLIGGASVPAAALMARPYGFLLLFAIVSTRSLWLWIESDRLTRGAAWVITLVLAIAMTPFAATLAAVHGIALVARRIRTGTFPPRLLPLGALGAALCAPIVPQVLALSDRRATLVIIQPPHPIAILAVALPWLAIIVVGLLMLAFSDRANRSGIQTKRALLLFGCWAFVPTVLLFLAGVAGDSPVFSDRYRSVALFGGAFLVGLMVISLHRPARLMASVVVALLTVAALASAEPQQHGWRGALEWAETTTAADADRVIALNPGLIESEDHSTLDDPEWHDYLSAPLATYPIDASVVLVSQNAPTPELVDDRLARLFTHDTVIVIDGPPGHRWQQIVREAAPEHGFIETATSDHVALTATVFTRDSP